MVYTYFMADKKQFATVDAYMASLPEDVRALLEKVRQVILTQLPQGVEKISYGIPAVTVDGSYVVYFSGWKRHISLYPRPTGDALFQKETEPYVGGKGTLRFPLDEPIPYALIQKTVRFLLEENKARRAR
jgi:uncharacterized protein YdhG (YjbR/CyaY superfamily)